MEGLAEQAAEQGHDCSSAALFVLEVRLRVDLGDLGAEIVALWLRLQAQLVSDVTQLLIFFVLTQGIEDLLHETPVCCNLEPQSAECHLRKMLAPLHCNSKLAKSATLDGSLLKLSRRSPGPPCVEQALFGLSQRCKQSHAMQASMITLLLNEAIPFGEGSRLLEVDHLVECAIYRLQITLLRGYVILPHRKAKPKLPVPEVVDAPFHDIELTALVAFESLGKHPLLKLAIEDESLGVPLREVVGYTSVLFHKHHRVARQLEPA